MTLPLEPSPFVIGVVLAGGRGKRLGGVRKHDLRVQGRSLFELACEHLRPQSDSLLISLADDFRRSALPSDIDIAIDRPDGPHGPAAGLYSAATFAMDKGGETLLLTTPVDAPTLPADFLASALPCIAAGDAAVVGSYRGRIYPTHGLWRTADLLASLSEYRDRARGPRLGDIALALGATHLDYAQKCPENPFEGANTLKELLGLSRRLKADQATTSSDSAGP